MQRLKQWLGLVICGWLLVACQKGTLPVIDIAARNRGVALPIVVAEIPLADEAALLDFRLDRDQQQLYITDRAGQLSILDANSYERRATLPVTGELTLDSEHQRLYVVPGASSVNREGQAVVTVIDTTTNAIIGTLPGRALAVDSTHNRLFVGEPVAMEGDTVSSSIRIYDSVTLAQTGAIPQAGIPFYNPLRNELLILAHTVYVLDLTTQQVTADLFPELAQQTLPWCNGCTWADELYLFPEANLLAIYMSAHCTGGGCTMNGPPHFFDATTLEPLTDLAGLPEVQRGCGSQPWLVPAIAGYTYRTYAFHRYATFANLMVYDTAGALVTWRDGLPVRLINPQTNQAYLAGGDLLDLATLTPIGRWPDGCIFAYDATHGLIYAAGLPENGKQGVLQIMAQSGAAPPAHPAPITQLPNGHPITAILPSPDYANDATALVLADERLLFRSTDGGSTWQQVQGGLPQGEPLHLHVAFSPTYAQDGTLYAAGYRDESGGEGVWRSTDGGDHWEPLWQGMTHLRIQELLFSPFFPVDHTLFAKANYYQIATGEARPSWQRSTDGGLTWSVVATGTADLELALPADLMLNFPEQSQAELPVRISEEHQLEYSPDRGVTWTPVPLPLADDEWVQNILPSPTYATDQTLYALSDYHLWRTTDNGHTWEQWRDVLDQPREYRTGLRVLALSSPLSDGRYQIFLGTADGQLLVLDSIDSGWVAI